MTILSNLKPDILAFDTGKYVELNNAATLYNDISE